MQSMMERHERKLPRPITREDLERRSTDEICVVYAEDWSRLRSGRAGRPVYVYLATNLTNGHAYNVELLEDDEGVPHSWCNCLARHITCKHARAALADLRVCVPEFGKGLLEGEAND
jgi:hypothetical protein